jgi:hypothetical protein
MPGGGAHLLASHVEDAVPGVKGAAGSAVRAAATLPARHRGEVPKNREGCFRGGPACTVWWGSGGGSPWGSEEHKDDRHADVLELAHVEGAAAGIGAGADKVPEEAEEVKEKNAVAIGYDLVVPAVDGEIPIDIIVRNGITRRPVRLADPSARGEVGFTLPQVGLPCGEVPLALRRISALCEEVGSEGGVGRDFVGVTLGWWWEGDTVHTVDAPKFPPLPKPPAPTGVSSPGKAPVAVCGASSWNPRFTWVVACSGSVRNLETAKMFSPRRPG